jgi:tetratricopeptide (TPR) repeat protein
MIYDSLVAAGDSTYAVFFNLGVCHERLDCPQKARTCFDEAIARSDSAIAGALYHQGAVLNALGEADKALACFSKALSVLAPDELQMFTCYRGMGESYYTQKKYREAAYAFHDALRYDATSLTTYYYLGICQAALGDQREAAKQLRTFLSIAEQMESPTESLKEMMDDARRRTLR